jgi:hypothetical protein
MPGSIWFPFRQGHRSEYLALYILSALGVVVKVPKEEDIGADFHCSLAHMDGKRLTFNSPFLVQTKSVSESKISYGGPDEHKQWRKEQIDWLFGQELPFLIGLVDKNAALLKLYSTSNMWAAWYSSGRPGEVVLQPDLPDNPSEPVLMPQGVAVPDWTPGIIGDGLRWQVPLGPPIVTISVDDSENIERIDKCRKMLSIPLWLEQENITYRRLNVHFSKWPLFIYSNEFRDQFDYGVFAAANSALGANTEAQIKALTPIVTTLAFNYKLQNRLEELERLKDLIKLVPEGPELGLLKDKVPELFT